MFMPHFFITVIVTVAVVLLALLFAIAVAVIAVVLLTAPQCLSFVFHLLFLLFLPLSRLLLIIITVLIIRVTRPCEDFQTTILLGPTISAVIGGGWTAFNQLWQAYSC